MSSMPDATDARLRSPEVARRLGIDGPEVYKLIFAGVLDGRPDGDGIVDISEASVEAYLAAHGAGNASNSLSNEPRRTDPNDDRLPRAETAPDLHPYGDRRSEAEGVEGETAGS